MKQFKMLSLAVIFMLTAATASMGNTIPVADAGEDQTVSIASKVKLDGMASFDDDKDRLTYSWELTAPVGSTTTLSNTTAKKPKFTADIAGSYVIQLIVNDGTIDSAPNSVTVHAIAEPVSLELVTILDTDVWETSGLAEVNGKFYTHNDSGDSELLYEINTTSGAVIRSIIVNGAANVDWEDLASDDTHLYIADVGNNLGNRDDLVIYKISKSDFDDGDNEVDAETIAFSYADQITFDPAPLATPYDAEALIAFKGKLYIFTKNWIDYTSKVYKIPTKPGIYEVESIAEKTLDIMVTGADSIGNSVALVGYTNPYISAFESIIIKLSGFDKDHFFSGSIAEHNITNKYEVVQVEAILFNTPTKFYLSAEGVTTSQVTMPPRLYQTEITK